MHVALYMALLLQFRNCYTLQSRGTIASVIILCSITAGYSIAALSALQEIILL